MSGRLLMQTRDELQKLMAAVEVWEEEGFNMYLLSDPQVAVLLTVLRICR